MEIVFDIASSVEFWRKRYPLNRAPKTPSTHLPSQCTYTKADVWALAPEWAVPSLAYYGKLHVLVFDASKKRESQTHQTHLWRGHLPEGAFFELSPGVYIESVEFMFLHAAQILDLEALIAFGDELCGLYSFDEQEKRGFRKRSIPLTSTALIAKFLDNAACCLGLRKAQRALRFVVDRSASPMETFDEMTMCLPYKLGGYCLPTATMNQKVTLTPRARRIAGRDDCYLDMGYLDSNLDVEHHGKHDHSSDEEKTSDRARVNGLKDMGIEVVELTIDQVNDLIAYEYIIERIAAQLHKRIRKEYKGALPARLRLREVLFQWNASSGRIR